MRHINPKIFPLTAFILLISPLISGCLTVTPYEVDFTRLPKNFDNFKIAVITDLHSHRFGKNQIKLIESVLEQKPDIVVLVGDIIDKHDRNIRDVRAFLDGICGKFPVYATAGNHEFENTVQFAELVKTYHEYGVIYLDGQTVLLERGDNLIAISSQKLTLRRGRTAWINNDTRPIYKNEFNIFLHHFGNEFDRISDEYDLVISGHLHGGIIRLFNRGLIGYNRRQVFFPTYSKGVYRKESGSVMVLSAGLGDTSIPRINNPREIVIITLKVPE